MTGTSILLNLRNEFTRIMAQQRAMGKGGARIAQSDLILIQDLSATKSVYEFPVLDDQTQALKNEEIRLNRNDEFIAQQIGVYLWGKSTYNTAVPALVATAPRWYTYAPVELNEDFGKSIGLWDGNLQIEANSVTYLKKWSLKKHNVVPESQFVTAVSQPSNDFSVEGSFINIPNITFSGARENKVIITLPTAITGSTGAIVNAFGGDETLNITAVALWFKGILSLNSSSFQSGK